MTDGRRERVGRKITEDSRGGAEAGGREGKICTPLSQFGRGGMRGEKRAFLEMGGNRYPPFQPAEKGGRRPDGPPPLLRRPAGPPLPRREVVCCPSMERKWDGKWFAARQLMEREGEK